MRILPRWNTVPLWLIAAGLSAWPYAVTAQTAANNTLIPILRGATTEATQAEGEAAVDEAIEQAGVELEQFPAPSPPGPVEEDDPYAPLGVRLGAFMLYPAIEAFLGQASNVFSDSVDPEPGTYYRIAPAVELQSDWSRHSLRGFVSADHESFFDHSGETTTALDAEVVGRLDITANDIAGLRLAYSIVPESRGDPNVPQAVVEPPDSEEAVAEGTYAHRFGRVEVALRGAAADFTFDNALLSDGTVVDNSDRDYREFTGAIRTSLDIDDGAKTVFVEVGANKRKYRNTVDANGIRRGSQGYDVLVGIGFNTGEPLSGELAVGYQQQLPDDPTLPDIDSIAFQGLLIWQPTALTTFTFEGSIEPEETTLDPSASGVLVYSAEVGVEHALRRNLIASAGIAVELSDYIGSGREEQDYVVAAGLEYLVNHWLSFQLDASYEQFDSNVPGENYDDTRVEFGVRLQR